MIQVHFLGRKVLEILHSISSKTNSTHVSCSFLPIQIADAQNFGHKFHGYHISIISTSFMIKKLIKSPLLRLQGLTSAVWTGSH